MVQCPFSPIQAKQSGSFFTLLYLHLWLPSSFTKPITCSLKHCHLLASMSSHAFLVSFAICSVLLSLFWLTLFSENAGASKCSHRWSSFLCVPIVDPLSWFASLGSLCSALSSVWRWQSLIALWILVFFFSSQNSGKDRGTREFCSCVSRIFHKSPFSVGKPRSDPFSIF